MVCVCVCVCGGGGDYSVAVALVQRGKNISRVNTSIRKAKRTRHDNNERKEYTAGAAGCLRSRFSAPRVVRDCVPVAGVATHTHPRSSDR